MISANDFRMLNSDSDMIQAAVDASVDSGECVVIPAKNERTGQNIWIIDKAIKLHSGNCIKLEGAHLRLADDAYDNIFKNSVARTDSAADLKNRQYDIHIYGTGNAVLDGGNHNGLTERNSIDSSNPLFGYTMLVNTLIHFHNAERICVEHIRVVNARYWGMTFHFCSNVRIRDIDFMTCGRCPNNDGIDIRIGCSDVIIDGITGYTQDDTIALTCLSDSEIEHVNGIEKSIHGVIISNVSACTRCAVVRLLNHCGYKLYNVIIENVQSSVEFEPDRGEHSSLRLPDAECVSWAVEPVYWSTFEGGARRAEVCIRIGENRYYNPDKAEEAAKAGDTYNITVRNIQAYSRYGVMLACTLCDSVVDNVQMFGQSACAVYMGKGIYDNVVFRNISFSRNAVLRDSDAGPVKGSYGYKEPAAVLFNDCKGTQLFFDGVAAHPLEKYVFAGTGEIHADISRIQGRNCESTVCPELQGMIQKP